MAVSVPCGIIMNCHNVNLSIYYECVSMCFACGFSTSHKLYCMIGSCLFFHICLLYYISFIHVSQNDVFTMHDLPILVLGPSYLSIVYIFYSQMICCYHVLLPIFLFQAPQVLSIPRRWRKPKTNPYLSSRSNQPPLHLYYKYRKLI